MPDSAPADLDRKLDEIAGELYGLPPDAFTAARDEQVRKARAGGEAALAREIARLRRPTQSAWLINLLWRDQREVLEQFFEVANLLRQAQAEAAGAELRELTTQRRQLENAMIRQARALAEKAGVEVGAATEREAQETLSAALAQPEVADEVRTGRLIKPVAYAGFGTLPTDIKPAAPRAEPPPAKQAGKPEAKIDDFAAKAAERARQRRAEAELRVQQARAALDEASQYLGEQNRAATSARKRHEDLTEELSQTESRLRDLKALVVTAEQAALAAARRRDQAEKDRQQARQALEEVEQALRELPSG